MRPLLFALMLLLVMVAAAPAGDELAALKQANALLQAEYELAKTAKPYLVVDLPASQLLLKVSGLSVATWPISGYRSWGSPATPKPALLVRKRSGDEPERDVQVVTMATQEESSAGEGELKALELADMPTAYRLEFDNGMQFIVRAAPAGWGGRVLSALATPYWFLSRPLISNWKYLRGKPYNELVFALPEQDARKLYWAMNEGSPCLIRTPEAAAVMPAPTPSGTKQ